MNRVNTQNAVFRKLKFHNYTIDQVASEMKMDPETVMSYYKIALSKFDFPTNSENYLFRAHINGQIEKELWELIEKRNLFGQLLS